jgi:hypothetical protein
MNVHNRIMDCDAEALSRDLVRCWRGTRSQLQFSRRLGYRTNVLYSWESGRRYPTASVALTAAARSGVDLSAALGRFYRTPPDWVGRLAPNSREGIAELLRDLRGQVPIGDLARRAGYNRFAVSRWLKGRCEPRLPEFLRLIEAASLRLLDYVATLADPESLPAIRKRWRLLEAGRNAAYNEPWIQAVLLVLELAAYRQDNARHDSRWMAQRLGTTVTTIDNCIDLLAKTNQIRWDGTHWTLARVLNIDTRRDKEAGRAIKRCWAKLGLDRIESGARGQFGYNVFPVSSADLERLRALHIDYFNQMRAIIAESEPPEHVVVTNLQLFALDE